MLAFYQFSTQLALNTINPPQKQKKKKKKKKKKHSQAALSSSPGMQLLFT
jgi:hypothetical protein